MEEFVVKYSAEAIEDLRSIYRYIAFDKQAPTTAQKQVSRIRENIATLDSMPSRHQAVKWEPWNSMGMHRFPFDNYVVFYLVGEADGIVTIIRIFYGGRDIKSIFANNQ